MANIKNIEIVINKEMAKEAYEAGARWAFGDEDGILTIEGFEDFWAKRKWAWKEVDTGEGQSNIPDVIKSVCQCSEPINQMTNNGIYCLRCENPVRQTVL